MDIHDLYELCVQSPGDVAVMLRAIHGGRPRVLGEDFAGTAALSRVWCQGDPEAHAIAVDLSGELLTRATSEARVQCVVGDVRRATEPDTHRADVIFVGNFSIGYLHTRAELVAYLRRSAARLNAGGVFVCDTYGGESAFRIGSVERLHPVPAEAARAMTGQAGAVRVRYTWEQREADPLTGMVTCVLHFRIERGQGKAREVIQEHTDAFVYRWRLWSVPELRDALGEAGLATTAVYSTMPDAVDGDGNTFVRPLGAEDVEESFIVLVSGRRA